MNSSDAPAPASSPTIEEILGRAADDGFVDPKDWSQALEEILLRIDQIAFREFPTPSILVTEVKTGYVDEDFPETLSSSNVTPSQANKENGLPSSPPQPELASSAHNASSSLSTNTIQAPAGTLPPPLLHTLNYVKTTLKTQFSKHPPHTIQRLTELTLRPKRQYRFVSPWLNALDRVVSVSSGAHIFPLPTVEPRSTATTAVTVNGSIAISTNKSASDEGLGGALLTPIPWLRSNQRGPDSPGYSRYNMSYMDAQGDPEDTEMGDYDSGREEEAVTQGELLRREQEASDPPAPVTPDDYDQPRVGGPEDIGMEDLGPQDHVGRANVHALDMEAAVGRPLRSPERDTQAEERAETDSEPPRRRVQGGKEFGDKDIEITDVDGLTDEDKDRMDIQGDTSAPDAVDATAR